MQSTTSSQISYDLSKSLVAHHSTNGSVSNGGSSSFRDLPTPRPADSTAASHASVTESSQLHEWSEVLPRLSPAQQTRRGSLRSPPTQDIGPSFQTTQADITDRASDCVLQAGACETRASSFNKTQPAPELQLQLSNSLSPEEQLRLIQQPPVISATSPALEELKSRHQQLCRLVFPESSRQAVIAALRNLQEKIRMLEEEKSLAEAQLAAAASTGPGPGSDSRARNASQHSQPIQTEPIATQSTSVQVVSLLQYTPVTTAVTPASLLTPSLSRGAAGAKADASEVRDLHTPEHFPSPPSPLPRLTAQSVHEFEKQLIAATSRCRVLEDQLKLMHHLLRGGDRPFAFGPALESTARPRMPAYRTSLDSVQATTGYVLAPLEEQSLCGDLSRREASHPMLHGGESTLELAEQLANAASKQSSLFSVSGSRRSLQSGFGSSDTLNAPFKAHSPMGAPASAEFQSKLFEQLLPTSEAQTPMEHMFVEQDVIDGPRFNNPAQIGQPLPSFVLSPIDATKAPLHRKSPIANLSTVSVGHSLRPPIGFDSPSPRKLVQSIPRPTAGATRDSTPLQSTFRARDPVVAPALDLCSSLSHLSPLAESAPSPNLLAGHSAHSPCLLASVLPVRDTRNLSTVASASNDLTHQSSVQVQKSVEEASHSARAFSVASVETSKYVSHTAAELTATTLSHADELGVGFDSLALDHQEERSNSVAGASAGVLYERVSRAEISPSKARVTCYQLDERQGSASRQSERSFVQQPSIPRAVMRDSSSNSSSSERLYSQVIPLGRHQQSTPPSAKSASKSRATPQSTHSAERSRVKSADKQSLKHESQRLQDADKSLFPCAAAASSVERSTQVDTQEEQANGVLQSSWRREQLRTVLAELESERNMFCAREVRLYEKLAAPHEQAVRHEIQRELALMHAKIEQRREQIEFLRAMLADESVLDETTAAGQTHETVGLQAAGASSSTHQQTSMSFQIGERRLYTAPGATLNGLSVGTAGQNEAASRLGHRSTSRAASTGIASSFEPSEVQIVTTVRARAGATLTRPVIVYNCPPASLANRLSSRRSDPTSTHSHQKQSSERPGHSHNGRASNI